MRQVEGEMGSMDQNRGEYESGRSNRMEQFGYRWLVCGAAKCPFRQHLLWSVRYNKNGSGVSAASGYLDQIVGWRFQGKKGRTSLEALLAAHTGVVCGESGKAPTPLCLSWRAPAGRDRDKQTTIARNF